MGVNTSIAANTFIGTVEGASFAPPAGAVTVQIDSTLNASDIVNTSGFLLDLYLEVSYDGGLTFTGLDALGWQSGPNSVLLGTTTPAAPGLATSGANGGLLPANGLFRARASAPQNLYFGVYLTFFDASGNIL